MNATASPREAPDRLRQFQGVLSVVFGACVLLLFVVTATNSRAVGLSPWQAARDAGLADWAVLSAGVAATIIPHTRVGSAVVTRVACAVVLVGCMMWLCVFWVLASVMYVLFTRA
jgi:hypothetical protein